MENQFNCKDEGVQAIQDTYSLKPNMLRHTREAEDVPEEVRKEYIEVLGAELSKEPQYIKPSSSPTITDLVDEIFHNELRHLALTASFLNKEGLE